ncbi:hypothetical protein BaRGS_00013054 [Batillaria attramentaria]|uniref:Uncharacterized protein n=1 Tax=Batillaria attramentaria TaxID=370345 RepID=A0ABD0L8C6_9CAEN
MVELLVSHGLSTLPATIDQNCHQHAPSIHTGGDKSLRPARGRAPESRGGHVPLTSSEVRAAGPVPGQPFIIPD